MPAIPRVSILEAMDHPQIWGPWFRDPVTWQSWRGFLGALFGLPLSEDGLELFRSCAGRAARPVGGFNEAWLVCGRKAGKSFTLALIACYLAVFKDWAPYLSPGEVGTIKVIATDRRQARVIYRYCRALLTRVPVLKQLVVHDSDDGIELRTGIVIEIQTASFRSVRGYTVIACLVDEIAFMRTDEGSANPDAEILAAIRPAMATIPGAMLLCASSPYARRGELWNAYRRWHGHDDAPALVWQAPTRTMNPTVSQQFIADELERDPAKGASEYLAQFRTDIETFIPREVIEALVVPGRFRLPRVAGINYRGFFDAAGGSGGDSFVSAVGHLERQSGIAVLDALIERRPPFLPSETVNEHATLFKSFGVREIVGDRWAGEFPAEAFRKQGIAVKVSDRVKSDIYRETLPMLTSGKVELLDLPRLAAQLVGLERRTARSGRDSVDHAPGQHDDLANAALGVLLLAATQRVGIHITPAMLEAARRPSRRPRLGDLHFDWRR